MDIQPDTHEVDQSEIRTQILLATASSVLKGQHSFTHMLTEVCPQTHKLKTSSGIRDQTNMKLVQKMSRWLVFIWLQSDVFYYPLVFRENKADVEAPVFLTGNAVESAHSKLFTLKSISSLSQQITRMWRKENSSELVQKGSTFKTNCW